MKYSTLILLLAGTSAIKIKEIDLALGLAIDKAMDSSDDGTQLVQAKLDAE